MAFIFWPELKSVFPMFNAGTRSQRIATTPMGVEIGINWMRGPSVCPFIEKARDFIQKDVALKGIKANRIWGEKRNYRTVRSFSVSLCVFVFSLVTEVLAESTEKQLSWREANSESELFRMDGICEKFCPTPFFQLAAGAVLRSEDNSNESMLCNLWNNKRRRWKELSLRAEMLQNVMLIDDLL